MGLRVLELPTNPVTGIEPDALRKVLPQINLCLLISNFSNPLGSCMPDEHKKEVVQMLTEYNIPLIEDDYTVMYSSDIHALSHAKLSMKRDLCYGVVLYQRR